MVHRQKVFVHRMRDITRKVIIKHVYTYYTSSMQYLDCSMLKLPISESQAVATCKDPFPLEKRT